MKYEQIKLDFAKPFNLVGVVMNMELAPSDCSINEWIRQVPQGALAGLVNGRRPDTAVPPWMTTDGPLRQAMMREFAFRAYAEEYATRGLCLLAAIAPSIEEME